MKKLLINKINLEVMVSGFGIIPIIIIDKLSRFLKVKVQCPICSWKGHKFSYLFVSKTTLLDNLLCPKCGSTERHRSLYLYLTNNPVEGKVLHFAPEDCLVDILKSQSREYISADIVMGKSQKREDIQALSFKDNTFDTIICLHVLEHVKDDKKALSELYRILKPEGKAIIQVPLSSKLNNCPTINFNLLPKEVVYVPNHLREYGEVFISMLRKTGFKVEKVNPIKRYDKDFIIRHGLTFNNQDRYSGFYHCIKRK